MGRKKKSAKQHCPTDGGLSYKQNSRFAEKPIQRNAANARERSRMRTLSKAFSRLKTTLPWVPPDTKLSKLDTLRSALSYIHHLNRILNEESGETSGTPLLPVRLTWPLLLRGSAAPQAPPANNSDYGFVFSDRVRKGHAQPTALAAQN